MLGSPIFRDVSPRDVLPYDCAPKEALGFPRRCAQLCIAAIAKGEPDISKGGTRANRTLRAIDVGCSVGGATFELTRAIDEVRESPQRFSPVIYLRVRCETASSQSCSVIE